MKHFNIWLLVLILFNSSCQEDANPSPEIPETTKGHKMLLIGNSFFKPYAQNLDILAPQAGFNEHNSTIVTRGGDNGRPINFWNDAESSEHQEIKATLDQGDIAFFGMTSGYDLENPTEGHRAWINYAIERNPDVTIFIAIPMADYPSEWQERAEANGFETIQGLYTAFVKDIVHLTLVDQLRAEFPNNTIFTIPTGWAGINLAQMKVDGELSDDIAYQGPKATSLFTDYKGHQGQIAIETGTLLWLNSLYHVDLSTHVYDTGFDTDLHQIAIDIMNNHDSDYKK